MDLMHSRFSGSSLVRGCLSAVMVAAFSGAWSPGAAAQAVERRTVRAIQLSEPLRVDGRLDEAVYHDTPPIEGLIQTVPDEGAPSTERTEVWVMFDATTLYVTCRCWDDAPPERWVANEMRRDTSQLRQNDHFGIILDTFHDRRNGFFFYANPLGARADSAVTDEGSNNADWNPVWDARTGRFEGGWTLEMAIPFKSLRYRSGTNQTWGINFRRSIRRKNEWAHLTALPASDGGSAAVMRVSAAADLVGLDLPAAGKNLELKPYAISSLTTDRLRVPQLTNEPNADVGGDLKYGITANLTADLTYNTDVAQVEVDEQQVNLTRFSLSYPEKRDFFLEGRGIFDFGRGTAGTGGNNPATPTLFYSRRIGLQGSRVVPIDVGGRVTGKTGGFSIGLMNIQTGEEPISSLPPTNFTVVRVKRDILRRSTIGALFTDRSRSTIADGTNQAYGADAAFNLYQNVTLGAYFANTSRRGLTGDDESYQGRFDYGGDRYGARAEYLVVGDHFNPEVGLVRRADFKRSFGSVRFSPRPRSIASVRKFTWEASVEYFENGAGAVETRVDTGHFGIELETSDQINVSATREYELLVRPFAISPGVTIPVGAYTFTEGQASYALGQQRRVSGTLSVEAGEFYDGTIEGLSLSGARVSLTHQLSVEPSVTIDRVQLGAGNFTTKLARARSDFAFTPRMFASALLQYSATDRVFSSNLRFRWEYSPGSEFFAVYTDEHDTSPNGPGLRNRAFVLKINRLFRF
jgi:hypothetical protein